MDNILSNDSGVKNLPHDSLNTFPMVSSIFETCLKAFDNQGSDIDKRIQSLMNNQTPNNFLSEMPLYNNQSAMENNIQTTTSIPLSEIFDPKVPNIVFNSSIQQTLNKTEPINSAVVTSTPLTSNKNVKKDRSQCSNSGDKSSLLPIQFPDISTDCDSTPEAGQRIVKKRDKINLIDKETIISAYENGEDTSGLGRLLGINPKTVRNIISRYNRTGQISSGKLGGYRKATINEEIGKSLLDFLDKNSTATLTEMKTFLTSTHQISPCLSTISNFLKNKHITHKKLQYSVVGSNSDRVKEIRSEYVANFLHSEYRSSQCIYIDETSINLWMQKESASSQKGQKGHHKVPNKPGLNICVVLAISNKGPVHHQSVIGSFTRESYQDFITELSLKLRGTKYYFIHDNSSIHTDILTTTPDHKIVKLPPYSPFLNPIEAVFSVLKKNLRSRMLQMNVPLTDSGKLKLINDLVSEELKSTNLQEIKEHYRRIKKYFPECILKTDIF